MKELEEMDEKTQEVFRQLARATNQPVQEVVERCLGLWKAVGEAVATIVEKLRDLDLPDMPRTPSVIKKDIKREKNHMRLKQLNKELNESYKAYKRK